MKQRLGFTLMEVLVVIAIIGMLAAISIAYLMEVRKDAQFTKTLQELRELEKGLKSYVLIERLNQWPSGGGDVATKMDFEVLVQETSPVFPGLADYLSSPIPTPPIGGNYAYYGSSGPYDPNNCKFSEGVFVRVENAPYEITEEAFEYIDSIVDNGDGPDCGQISFGGSSGSLYLRIASGPNDI